MREIFAEKIRTLRAERGLTQSQLGEKIGLDQRSISNIERADKFVSVETLVLLADFFGVSTDFLLGRG